VTDYESAALPAELQGLELPAKLAPVAAPAVPRARHSGSLQDPMLAFALSQSTGVTLALLATFIGIGVIVNVLIVYIVALVIAEHKQNQEREPGVG
jgi:hypothetical protein